MPNENIVAEGLRLFLSFKYDDLDRSFNDSMIILSEAFEASGAMIFRKNGERPFALKGSSSDKYREKIDTLIGMCKVYGYEENSEFCLQDGTKGNLLNLKIDDSNYTIALITEKSLEDINTKTEILVNCCFKKILSDIEPILISQTYDRMTGVFNRNEYERKIETLKKEPFKYVVTSFVDIFSLKRMNDKHTHSAGDRYIKEVANKLKEYVGNIYLPDVDIEIFRFGGDEFIILATAKDPGTAERVEAIIGERLEQAKGEIESDHLRCTIAGSNTPLTITSFDHKEASGPAVLLDNVLYEADEGMHLAKSKHYAQIGDRRQSIA